MLLSPQNQTVVFCCFAYLFFALGDSCLRLVANGISNSELIFLSSFYSVVLFLAYLGVRHQSLLPLRTTKPFLHLVRSILLTSSFVLIINALPNIPFSLFYSLSFTLTIWACLGGFFLNKEKISFKQILGILGGLVGIFIALRPDPSDFNLFGCSVIVAMALTGSASVLARWIPFNENPINLAFYPRLASAVLFAPFAMLNSSGTIHWHTQGIIIFSAFFSSIAITIIGRAFQVERASLIAPTQYSQIIWSTAIGYFLWHEIPDLNTIGGAIMIMCGGYTIMRYR
jgi:S-adenosylmethionine uptake transporter